MGHRLAVRNLARSLTVLRFLCARRRGTPRQCSSSRPDPVDQADLSGLQCPLSAISRTVSDFVGFRPLKREVLQEHDFSSR
jgi:hypothetical protein